MAANHVVTGNQYRDIDRKMTEIKRQLTQRSGSPLDPQGVLNALQDVIENGAGTRNIIKTLRQMIVRGRFDSVHSGITAYRFPVDPNRFSTKGLETFVFSGNMSADQVLEYFAKIHYVAAGVEQTLAYAARNPSAQVQHRVIVSLGAEYRMVDGDDECGNYPSGRVVLTLNDLEGKGRGLHLSNRGGVRLAPAPCVEDAWPRGTAFLAQKLD